MFFFFFQAEDGIRDSSVTGVQTCALPIWLFSSVSHQPLLENSLMSVPTASIRSTALSSIAAKADEWPAKPNTPRYEGWRGLINPLASGGTTKTPPTLS